MGRVGEEERSKKLSKEKETSVFGLGSKKVKSLMIINGLFFGFRRFCASGASAP